MMRSLAVKIVSLLISVIATELQCDLTPAYSGKLLFKGRLVGNKIVLHIEAQIRYFTLGVLLARQRGPAWPMTP